MQISLGFFSMTQLRQIEMKALTIRGKLSIYGSIDILADRILIVDGGHLDVKGGLVNFLLTGSAFGNPFCYRSRLEGEDESFPERQCNICIF